MTSASRRVLMVNDIANTAPGMRDALRSCGWDVDLMSFPLRADHPSTAALLRAQLGFATKTAWQSRRYDLLHIHYGYFGLLGRLSPRPYVLHCHGTDLRANLVGKLRRPTLAALNGAEHIFYATPDLAQYLSDKANAKASFCPNIVNLDDFRPPSPARTDASGIHVLFISKLDPTKGLTQLSRALHLLLEDSRIAKVSMFDFGKATQDMLVPDTPKLNRIQRLPYRDMPDLINAHDIVVGQIELGAIGMSELEAMACARPLVAHFRYNTAYEDPMPYIQAKTGEEVATEVLKLAVAPALRHDLGARARKWVCKFHSKEAVADQLDQTFSRLLTFP